jgi:hypothetical protein
MPEFLRNGLSRFSSTLGAGLVSLGLAVFWISTLTLQKSWGWDESMHAQLPAVRMLLSLQEGDLGGFSQVVHTSVQYPFGWPLLLTLIQAVLGISEFVCRATGLVAWAGVIFGTFLLAQEVQRANQPEGEGATSPGRLFPWLALIFTALSPLGLGYGQSLFLEVPSAFCAVFALRAWLRRNNRRGEAGEALQHLVAGAWLTAAFFIKFNYGMLLIFGCCLDAGAGLLVAGCSRQLWQESRRLLITAAPLFIGLVWWLGWPIPFGLSMGEHHRESMLAFLGGNHSLQGAPAEQRVLFWVVFLSYTARLFALQVFGLLSSVRWALSPGARLLWCVFLGAGLPVWTHSFQLDRFLIPNAPVFWTLAALGVASIIPRRPGLGALVGLALALVTLLFPSKDAVWVAQQLGVVPAEGPGRAYVVDILASKHQLGAQRRFWTPGLAPAVTDELLGLIVDEVGQGESVGWIGGPSEISPAAVHLALLAQSGESERFLRDAHLPMDVSFTGEDPNWTSEQLAEFCARFDLVITTDPPDPAGRASRNFIRRYATLLVDPLGWSAKALGKLTIQRELGPPLSLTVYSLRPPVRD